ncbi:hypothetical protein BGZ58_005666 [Dissophora ornata]|nr:hypothetical protein BGZ58_005666 [Dissophora ornata]
MPDPANPTTVQEHLRELHALVRDSLKQWDLATNTATATVLEAQGNPNRLTNELHPLGPVQVGTLQRDYKDKIAAIRSICLSFAQGPLHQSLNGGDPSTATSFRKYSSLLKDETGLEEAVHTVKANLKQCQNTIRAASHDGSIKTDHLINTIRDMATELGLECYLETGSRPDSLLPVSTLTIGGNVIVIDIDVESTGAILRVKVSYASEIHQDERATLGKGKTSEALIHSPDCSRDFDAFSRNLRALATLDSFSKKYPSVDFFHNIRSMDVDLKELYKREMIITGRDLRRVVTQGHGIPMNHAVLPGPSVAYWASKESLLDVSWDSLATAIEQGANEKVKIPFHRISITMEESTSPLAGYLPIERSGFLLSEAETLSLNSVPYGSIMNDQGSVSTTTILQQPLKWIVPNNDASVEAAYVAVLHPPVIVAEDVAKQLAALSNQAGLNTTMGFHKDPGYLSLQECLINHNMEQTQWEITLDRGPNALLRQQMVFNTLFQSCFQETTSATETKKRVVTILPGTSSNNSEDNNPEVSIVIQTPQPPKMILASFLNPYTKTNMMLEILLDAGTGQPTVRLVNSGASVATITAAAVAGNSNMIMGNDISSDIGVIGSGDQQQQGQLFVVESEKLTKVLQTCDSIPILVRWVLKRSQAWMKERHHHSHGSKSHLGHLGRRASSYVEEGGILKRPRV